MFRLRDAARKNARSSEALKKSTSAVPYLDPQKLTRPWGGGLGFFLPNKSREQWSSLYHRYVVPLSGRIRKESERGGSDCRCKQGELFTDGEKMMECGRDLLGGGGGRIRPPEECRSQVIYKRRSRVKNGSSLPRGSCGTSKHPHYHNSLTIPAHSCQRHSSAKLRRPLTTILSNSCTRLPLSLITRNVKITPIRPSQPLARAELIIRGVSLRKCALELCTNDRIAALLANSPETLTSRIPRVVLVVTYANYRRRFLPGMHISYRLPGGVNNPKQGTDSWGREHREQRKRIERGAENSR